MKTKIKTKLGVFSVNTPNYIFIQAIIWDKFAKASPIIAAVAAVILYLFGFRDTELIVDTLLAMGGVTIIVWWFWIVYSVATIAYIIDRSSSNLIEVLNEIREVREEFVEITRQEKP
jgi:hypothetical protein